MIKATSIGDSFGCRLSGSNSDSPPGKDWLLETLMKDKAVYLHGFNISKDEFIEISDACCNEFSSYVGGGLRFRGLNRETLGANGTLMSTTGGTQGFSLPLHGEMYYQKTHPKLLWFYCEEPPSDGGGETLLADACRLHGALSEGTKKILEMRRIRYIRDLDRDDWQTMFGAKELEVVDALCRENDMSLTSRDRGGISIEYSTSALREIENRGVGFINNLVMIWKFEQLFRSRNAKNTLGFDMPTEAPFTVRWEDKSEIPASVIEDIVAAADDVCSETSWSAGDLLVLDNSCILHGRRKTVCKKRKILVRMGGQIA